MMPDNPIVSNEPATIRGTQPLRLPMANIGRPIHKLAIMP